MEYRVVDRIPRPCQYEGCNIVVQNTRGFCPKHYLIAYPCEFGPSCKNRCAAHSRRRYCQEHAWYAKKVCPTTQAKPRETGDEE